MTSAVASLAVSPGRQSVLDPAGPYAKAIADLWWTFLIVLTIIYVLVVLTLLVAVVRGRRARAATSQRRMTVTVGSAVAVTTVILFGFIFLSTRTGNALTRSNGKPPVKIRVTAQQWWWHVEYEGMMPARNVTTANEIYLPVGIPAEVILESRDVIHSLWIPNLAGKRDLIPGHKSSFFVQADQPGVWDGQCAEFCGLQHAKMRLSVTALGEKDFATWVDAQLQPAAPPRTPKEQKGQQVFLARSCPLCHTIAGTAAGGKTAPDLTHVASRRMIASASAPNTTGHLAGWILDPHAIKPGTNMPPNPMPSEELDALLAYLRSLK